MLAKELHDVPTGREDVISRQMVNMDNLWKVVVEKPLREGCNRLDVLSGYATAIFMRRIHEEAKRQEGKSPQIRLLVGMAGHGGMDMGRHQEFRTFLEEEEGEIRYRMEGPYHHEKLFVWYRDTKPFLAWMGSANATEQGFGRRGEPKQNNLMVEVDAAEAAAHFQEIWSMKGTRWDPEQKFPERAQEETDREDDPKGRMGTNSTYQTTLDDEADYMEAFEAAMNRAAEDRPKGWRHTAKERRHRKYWYQFVRWALSKGERPLPADEAVVDTWIGDPALRGREWAKWDLACITLVHQYNDMADPTAPARETARKKGLG